MLKSELIAFEEEVTAAFERKEIRGPIHLCSEGQAEPLIEIFKQIKRTDWVLSTWRSHWHALLHGIPRDLVMAEIMAGRSMALNFPQYRFMTSAIMGGMLPIACGLAAHGFTVWVFSGDMCASTGAYADAVQYATRQGLPVNFVIEDNGLSVNTPTQGVWGEMANWWPPHRYKYARNTQHSGTNTYVAF